LANPFRRGYRGGVAGNVKAMLLDPANGYTMVVIFFGWFNPGRPLICTIPMLGILRYGR
jgi:hypothetical protein